MKYSALFSHYIDEVNKPVLSLLRIRILVFQFLRIIAWQREQT